MSDNKFKPKRKKYFSSNLMMKKRRDLCLQPGFKGFISTTNGNEKQCIRESYNLLNEYADKIYGEENKVEEKEKPESSDEKKDIMDDFQSEIESLKAQTPKSGGRRFQAVDTGIINCIFIKTNLDDPVTLMDHVVKDLSETKMVKTRFLIRMIPVEVTCKAYIDEVKKAAGPLLDKYFKGEPTTFCLVFNRRHNNNLERDIVIKELADMVSSINEDHKVNLTSATLTIVVEVMKNICAISVIRDYFKYCKYNLFTICGVELPTNDKNEKSDPVKSDDADVTSTSSAVETPKNTTETEPVPKVEASENTTETETVPEVETSKPSEPDTEDAQCKGEPAPAKAETTVHSSTAEEKL